MLRKRLTTIAAHRPLFVNQAQKKAIVIEGAVERHAGSGAELFAPVRISDAYPVYPNGAVNPNLPIGFNDFYQATKGAIIFPVTGDYHADEFAINELVVNADPNDEAVRLRNIVPTTEEQRDQISIRLRQLNSSEPGIAVQYQSANNQVVRGRRYNQENGPPDQAEFEEAFLLQQKRDAVEEFQYVHPFKNFNNDANPLTQVTKIIPKQHLTVEEFRLKSRVGPKIMNHIKPIHDNFAYDALGVTKSNVVQAWSRRIPSFMLARKRNMPIKTLKIKQFNPNKKTYHEVSGGALDDDDDEDETLYERNPGMTYSYDSPYASSLERERERNSRVPSTYSYDAPFRSSQMGPSAKNIDESSIVRTLPANVTALAAGQPAVPSVNQIATDVVRIQNAALLNATNTTVVQSLAKEPESEEYPVVLYKPQLLEPIRQYSLVVNAAIQDYMDLRTSFNYKEAMGDNRSLTNEVTESYSNVTENNMVLVKILDQRNDYDDNERALIRQVYYVIGSIKKLYVDFLESIRDNTLHELDRNPNTAIMEVQTHLDRIENIINNAVPAIEMQQEEQVVPKGPVKRKADDQFSVGEEVTGPKQNRTIEPAVDYTGVLVDPRNPPSYDIEEEKEILPENTPLPEEQPENVPEPSDKELENISTQLAKLEEEKMVIEHQLAIGHDTIDAATTQQEKDKIEYELVQAERRFNIIEKNQDRLITQGEEIQQRQVVPATTSQLVVPPQQQQGPSTLALHQQNNDMSQTLNQLIQNIPTTNNVLQQFDNSNTTYNQLVQPVQIINNGTDQNALVKIDEALVAIHQSNQIMVNQLMLHVEELRDSQTVNPSLAHSIAQQMAGPIENLKALLDHHNQNAPVPNGPSLSQPLLEVLQSIPIDIGNLTQAIKSNTTAVNNVTTQVQKNPDAASEIIRDWLAREPIISPDLLDKLNDVIKTTPSSYPNLPPIIGSRRSDVPVANAIRNVRQKRLRSLIKNAPEAGTVTEETFTIKIKPRRRVTQKKINPLDSSSLV